MPLDIKDFDRRSINKTYSKMGKNQIKIAKLFQEYKGEAFTQSEIKRKLGIAHDAAVNTALHSLQTKSLVFCKEIEGTLYWRGKSGLYSIDFSNTDGNGKTTADVEDGN